MLSIIIPTLNEEKTLEKTLLSLKELTLYDYEVIVSDGKSTDETLNITRKYTNKIVEYADSARQTIGQARNMGGKIAKGDFLVFLDADVIIPDINNFFIRALDNFKINKALVGLAPFINYNIDEATFTDRFFARMMNFIYYISNNYLHIGQAAGEFQMVRRDVFLSIGGYNEGLAAGEDVDFFSRLAKIGRTKIDSDLVVFQSTRRVHKTGWLRLLWSWHMNFLCSKFLKKSFDKEWKPIR